MRNDSRATRAKSKPIKKMRRNKAYTVRYNDREDAIIQAAADEASLEVGSWIRMVSFLAASRTEVTRIKPR
jgi:Leu/Phe-tRNA-protein transferase